MEVAVAAAENLRLKKVKRNELTKSDCELFPALESLDYSFYHSIDSLPLRDGELVWPDLTTAYEPPLAAPPALVTSTPLFVRDCEDSTHSSVEMLVPPPMAFHAMREDEGAHAHIRQLRDSEMRWRDTLNMLYDNYNPGSALTQVQQVEQQVRDQISDIDHMLEKSVLQVEDLFSVLSLKDRFENVLHRCAVIESEEIYLAPSKIAASAPVVASGATAAAAAATKKSTSDLVLLEWTDQPLPKSFKNKNRARQTKTKKKGHCTMKARLVCAPGVTFVPSSTVTAHFYMVDDEDVTIKRTKKRGKSAVASVASERHEQLCEVQIQNNEEKMMTNGRVSFDFRFPAGTRNKPVLIRLHVNGTMTLPDGSKQSLELVSEPTHCFIITTNECQYETAELKLLMMDLFKPGEPTCSWAAFVNALNVRWMRVTRQEADSSITVVSDRTLSAEELQHVANYFPGAPKTVTREQVATFYSFFGKATHHLRHNLAFRELLMEGLVWGIFLSKSEAETLLFGCSAGAFLIRASESSPGNFCISWKASEIGQVRHALLDVKMLAPPITNLAEYINSKPFLVHLLQPFVMSPNGKKVMQTTLRRKEDAFRNYLTNAVSQPSARGASDSGYLDLDLM